MYEDTLLEKLTYILATKGDIMEAIRDIGSTSIDSTTLLKDYPSKIKEVHSNIKDVCKYLKFAVDGGDINNITIGDKDAQDILPYIRQVLLLKDKLSVNLNAIGTFSENTETLESLVDKVYSGSIALLERVDILEAQVNQLEADKANLTSSNEAMSETIKDLETELDEINGELI